MIAVALALLAAATAPEWRGTQRLFVGTEVLLSWAPAARAAAYEVEVSSSQGEPVVRERTEGLQLRVALAPGLYVARVAAEDAAGHRTASEPRPLVVARVGFRARPGEAVLSLEAPPGVLLLLDGGPAPPTVHAPGPHVVTVRSEGEEQQLSFDLAPPQLAAQLEPEDDALVLRLALDPSLPREPLTLRTDGGAGRLEPVGEGLLRARIVPPLEKRVAVVEVLWAGVVIARLEGTAPGRAERREEQPSAKRELTPGNVAGDAVGVEADALPILPRRGGALQLRLGSAGPRAALEVDGPAQPWLLLSATLAGADRGWFSLRAAALPAVAPVWAGASATFPFDPGGDAVRLRLLTGASLRLRQLELATTQALALGVGNGVRPAWDSAWNLSLPVAPWLLVSAEVDALVGRVARLGTVIAPAAALGLRARWQRVQAGASVRVGQDEVWRRASALLDFSVDVGR